MFVTSVTASHQPPTPLIVSFLVPVVISCSTAFILVTSCYDRASPSESDYTRHRRRSLEVSMLLPDHLEFASMHSPHCHPRIDKLVSHACLVLHFAVEESEVLAVVIL